MHILIIFFIPLHVVLGRAKTVLSELIIAMFWKILSLSGLVSAARLHTHPPTHPPTHTCYTTNMHLHRTHTHTHHIYYTHNLTLSGSLPLHRHTQLFSCTLTCMYTSSQIQYTEKEMERFERRSKRPSIETSPLPQGAAASKDSQPLRIANSLPSPSFFPGQLGVGGTDFSPVTTVGMTSELVSVGAESESQRGAATPSKILVGHTEWSATEEESEIFVVKEGSGHGKMEREKRDYKTKSADSEK